MVLGCVVRNPGVGGACNDGQSRGCLSFLESQLAPPVISISPSFGATGPNLGGAAYQGICQRRLSGACLWLKEMILKPLSDIVSCSC